jgi:hypothetical protein
METWWERWNIKINEDKAQGIYFSHSRRPPMSHLTSTGRNILFVNSAKYLDVIFDKKVTWRLHIEMIEAKAFRTFIRLYSLLKNERLIANIKSTLHKALIRSVMTYASPAWEFAADTHLMKLQRLQIKDLRTIGNFPRRTPVRDLHIGFKIPYVYDYTEWFRRSYRHLWSSFLKTFWAKVSYKHGSYTQYLQSYVCNWNFSKFPF